MPEPKPVREKRPLPLAHFEALSRLAVSRMEVPQFCRLRRCSRKDYCDGELKRRDVPSAFCGEPGFATFLPLCIANADDDWLRAFITYWSICYDEHFVRPIHPPGAEPRKPPLPEDWPLADKISPPAPSGGHGG